MTEYIELLMMPAPRDLSADGGRGYDHEDMDAYATAAVLTDRAARPTVQPSPDIQEKYNELLYAVGIKWPNETRHETALRYIREAEIRAHIIASAKETP